eukprot:gene14197-15678_t
MAASTASSGQNDFIKTHPISQEYDVHWNKKLGSGISGPVRICTHKVSKQHYALKCLIDRAKSRTEVELHYKCNHPNIVSVVDVFANDLTMPGEIIQKSYLMMVLELMEGGELFERIRRKVSFTEKEACEITKQIASGLGHTHIQNIAHRDLKPENLLLRSKVEPVVVKIADFGFAKEDKGDLMTPQFTPYYVSPQVLEAQKYHKAQKLGHIPPGSPPYTYSKSCDMWSLGVIIYIMLCGYPPFYSENPRKQLSQGMRRRIMAGQYDFPPHEWSRVSDSAKDVVQRLLNVNPEVRMSIQELLIHPWLNEGKAPNTPLQSPHHLMDQEAFEEAMNAHSAMLTDMRLPDHTFNIDAAAMGRNPIIQRRKAPDQGYQTYYYMHGILLPSSGTVVKDFLKNVVKAIFYSKPFYAFEASCSISVACIRSIVFDVCRMHSKHRGRYLSCAFEASCSMSVVCIRSVVFESVACILSVVYESSFASDSSGLNQATNDLDEVRIQSIRDIVGYCYLPAHHISDPSFEAGLVSLAIRAIDMNPQLAPLHKALRLEAFDGREFQAPVNKKRLTSNLCEVIRWISEKQ